MTTKKQRGARPRRPASISSAAILRRLKRTAADEERRLAVEVLANLHAALNYTRLSRAELGERLGVKKAAVSKLLNGQRALTLSHVARIAHALGMSAHVSFRTPAAVRPKIVDPDQHAADVAERNSAQRPR